MCAEWRQIWRLLIWLGLRRGFSAGHKEIIILRLLLLLFTLLHLGTGIWRGRLTEMEQREEERTCKMEVKYWKGNTVDVREGRETQKLSGCFDTDPALFWESFYRTHLTEYFFIWKIFREENCCLISSLDICTVAITFKEVLFWWPSPHFSTFPGWHFEYLIFNVDIFWPVCNNVECILLLASCVWWIWMSAAPGAERRIRQQWSPTAHADPECPQQCRWAFVWITKLCFLSFYSRIFFSRVFTLEVGGLSETFLW